MKLIKPSFEIIKQGTTLPEIYQHIEKCGKICYKSEHTIKEGSAEKFYNMIADKGHLSVMEHGTIYLKFPVSDPNTHTHNTRFKKYLRNPYSKVNVTRSHYYVTTNMRVLVEHGWLEDLQFISEPTEHHYKRITVKFVCDRGILAEFTRHRVFSFSCESTRYCNYNLDRFGGITFIIPNWSNLQPGEYEQYDTTHYGYYPDISTDLEKTIDIDNDGNCTNADDELLQALFELEYRYNRMITCYNWKPQQARNILPLATKCELMMTGFVKDWKHFFKLRNDSTAHPQAIELAKPLEKEFQRLNLI